MSASEQTAPAGLGDFSLSNPVKTVRWKQGLRWFVREPFFHFVLLGAALFAFNEYLEARAKYSYITITKSNKQDIVNNYLLQNGSLPSPQQAQFLLDSYIKEQVFYHEALRLNLDKDDEIIRRRLVQKYEFLQQDLGVAKNPTDDDLKAYYQSHAASYLIPEKVTFSHVYFSTDTRGESGAKAAAEQALIALNTEGVSRAPDQGDTFAGLYDYSALSSTYVARLFGAEGLATAVFKQPLQQWTGPFRSGYGWHIVNVSAKSPATAAPFDVVKEAVKRDYIEFQRGQKNAETLAKLKQTFTINVEQ